MFRVYLPSIAVFWLVPSLDLLFFSWLQLFHGNNWFRGITEKGATDIGMAGQCIFSVALPHDAIFTLAASLFPPDFFFLYFLLFSFSEFSFSLRFWQWKQEKKKKRWSAFLNRKKQSQFRRPAVAFLERVDVVLLGFYRVFTWSTHISYFGSGN